MVAADADHQAARHLFERALSERWALITTNVVMIETYALLLSRTREGRNLALGFLDDLEAGMCHIERVSMIDESRAIALLREHGDKEYSLCDALSFVVMERLGANSAIAFDTHFRQYGKFEIL